MKKEEKEVRDLRLKEFYKTCGEILGIEHNFQIPQARKTRWNDRQPGNGRYEGFGIICRFSDTLIYITSRHNGRKVLRSEQEVYEYLKAFKNKP